MAKPELRDHRKFLKLRRLLGEPTPHVLGYLDCLWHRGYQTGTPFIGDELDVEAAAEFPGEPGAFTKAALESGFIEQDADGSYLIHDLYDHAPKYARMRMQRKGTAPARSCPKQTDTGTRVPHLEADGLACETKPRTDIREPKSDIREPKTSKAVAAEPPARPRDLLFDALVEVTGSDPKLNASHVAKVRVALAGADPPYQPEEVRVFATRLAEFCPWAVEDGRRPTLGEIEKFIGGIRHPKVVPRQLGARVGPSKEETARKLAQMREQERKAAASGIVSNLAEAFRDGGQPARTTQ